MSKVRATAVFTSTMLDARQPTRASEALLTCEVAVAASATEHRRAPQRRNRHCEDVAAAVVQVMRSVVVLQQYPNSHIHINVEFLHLDGAEKPLAITAASLALANARVAMRDVVCAFTVGVIDQQLLIDLTTEEVRSECPTLSVAFAGHNPENLIWCEALARVAPEMLQRMLDRAQECARGMFLDVERALRDEAASFGEIEQ